MTTAARFHAACAVLASLALAIALVPELPMLSNADDHQRYYVGGYLAAARVGLAPAIAGEPNDVLDVPDRVERGRRLGMLSPYAPVWIVQTAFLDAIRRAMWRGVPVHTWVVMSATAAGLAWLVALFWTMRRLFPEHSLAWLLTVLAVPTFVHQSTHPADFMPRDLSTFATGLAVALALAKGRADARTWALLALGAAFHNFQQALNVAAAAVIVLLLQPRRLVDTIVPAVGLVAVSLGVTYATSSTPMPVPSGVLGASRGGDWMTNWSHNQAAAIQVTRYMAPILGLLVASLGSAGRGVAAALAVAVSIVATALLTDPGPYLGEYPNRVGGAWNCAIMVLLLQKDWLAAAVRLTDRWRSGAIAVCLMVLAVFVIRMDARYLFVQRLEEFKQRVDTGLNYLPSSTEAAGLALIPR